MGVAAVIVIKEKKRRKKKGGSLWVKFSTLDSWILFRVGVVPFEAFVFVFVIVFVPTSDLTCWG